MQKNLPQKSCHRHVYIEIFKIVKNQQIQYDVYILSETLKTRLKNTQHLEREKAPYSSRCVSMNEI